MQPSFFKQYLNFLLAEVPLEQSRERLAVAGFVASHLMHGVVDRVEVILLGQLGQLSLAFGRAVLGIHTHFKILLGGVGHDLAQQLGELRRVLSLFIGGLLPVDCLLYTSRCV